MRHVLLILWIPFLFNCTKKDHQQKAGTSATDTVASSNGEFEDLPIGAIKEEFPDAPDLVGVRVGAANFKTMSGHYLNGKKDGTWVQYYPNGLVMSITSYVKGKKEGIYLEMSNNNQVKKRYYYHLGLRHGEYKEYNFTNIKEERNYVNGKIEGVTKIYYDNSKLMEVGLYKNGLRDGISKWYDQDGKVTIEYEYKNGELVKK